MGQKKLKEIIIEFKPKAIVNVFPFGAAPEIACNRGILTFTVLTDNALHSRWIHPDTDKYFVATNELKAQLLKRGFSGQQIEVTGIPIREAFYNVSKTGNMYVKLLNPHKKMVLISAGAYGVLNELEYLVDSLFVRSECQIVIDCGRNEQMELTLKYKYAGNHQVHILGFVDNVQDLMAVSTCIITKAGGLTLSESLTLLLPVFIFNPFGGQEKENGIYFQRQGIAQVAYSMKELVEEVLGFLSDDTATGIIAFVHCRQAGFR